jgi:sigma-B regulation protein RsbU (phosphoserine phosphatase)
MTLRTKLSLAFVLVAVVGTGGALVVTERYLSWSVEQTLKDELKHASAVYRTFLEERGERRIAEARVVAEEPRLKAVVRTLDIDQVTLEDVSDELKEAAGADLFAVTDREGETVADVSAPKLGNLKGRPELVKAASGGGGVAIWPVERRLFQTVVRPLQFGTDVTGYLVTGFGLTGALLETARAQTGCEVAVVLDGALIGSASRLTGALEGAALGKLPEGTSELTLSGERFLALTEAHPAGAPPGARLVLMRSLDEALASHAAVRRALLLIGLAALLLGVGTALVLGRSLSRRLERLAAAAVEVGKGAVKVKVETEGNDEVAAVSSAFNQMTDELERSRAALVHKERLEKELQIARQIQTALLPKSLTVPGYEVAATMLPADDVGGDLYDVRVADDGHVWMCIGDVTSHGVTPGLIMMMVQSALSALIARSPSASPKETLIHLNRVIYDNVRERLGDDNYLTLTVLRSAGPGRFVYSGAHLDLLIRRASGKVERLPTPGLWVGVVPDITNDVEESALELAVGDTLVLYSDGLTEARDANGKMFDVPGVERVLTATKGPSLIRDQLMKAAVAHMAHQDDDITIVVIERTA